MARRTGYTVTTRNGSWAVVKYGAKRASSLHTKKSAAVREAKRLAKKNKPSELQIQGKNGKIQRKYSYGNEPESIPG